MAFKEETFTQRLLVFRNLDFHPTSLVHQCHLLCANARYKRCAKLEDAPKIADCLTAIHFIFQGAFPTLDWIGNMPRNLLYENKWQIHDIAPSDLRFGDILFLKKNACKRDVTHVAMSYGLDNLFHCSYENQGAVIEKINAIFVRYTQPSKDAMFSFIDPRTSND